MSTAESRRSEHRPDAWLKITLERTFGETRRRTKVIGRLPGERTCVALVFAVLVRQSRGWRGMTMTPRATRRLQDLRRQLFAVEPETELDGAVTAAA